MRVFTALKDAIESLAHDERVRFPLAKLFVVEGSRRSAHSNAYMYGFWKNKRVVLFDTLIAGFDFAREAAAAGLAGKSSSKKETECKEPAADSSAAPAKEAATAAGATATAEASSSDAASAAVQNPRLDADSASAGPSAQEAGAQKDESATATTAPKGCDTEEILAVLGHEFGHWKYWHFLLLFTFSQVFSI